jgi:hypothetical protein
MGMTQGRRGFMTTRSRSGQTRKKERRPEPERIQFGSDFSMTVGQVRQARSPLHFSGFFWARFCVWAVGTSGWPIMKFCSR